MTQLKRPEKIGPILKSLLRNLGLDKKIEEQEALMSWDQVVGDRIDSISRVKLVRDGKLYVEVKGTVWMSEIQMMKIEIIEKLNKGKQRGKIHDLILLQWRDKNGK